MLTWSGFSAAGCTKVSSQKHLFNSGQDRDGEVKATELRVGEDLETFRHRQGWFPRRRRVRTSHAPNPGQNRRARPALGIATTPRSTLQAQLNIIIILNRFCNALGFIA